MIRERTWLCGPRFYKRIDDPAKIDVLIRLARLIADAGGQTPVPEHCPEQNALSFPAIDGTTGVALIHQAALLELLAPLQAIRRANAPDLPIYDAFAKIIPRLGPDTPSWLTSRIARLQQASADGEGIVHGDFHFGQLIRDDMGRVWVIDLDDMARGPIEADLGNVVAHLATRPETRRADLADGVRFWSGQVLDAWNGLNETYDLALFWLHVDVALTRRALKLRDLGQSSLLTVLGRSMLFCR